jgi:prepilin-type N-terminal cleavage/methylation domain-containing protein
MKSKKAFTLIELLIVLAVIAICVAVAIPIIGGAIKPSPLQDQNIRLVDQYERNGVHHEIVRVDSGKCYDRYDGGLGINIEEVPCPN